MLNQDNTKVVKFCFNLNFLTFVQNCLSGFWTIFGKKGNSAWLRLLALPLMKLWAHHLSPMNFGHLSKVKKPILVRHSVKVRGGTEKNLASWFCSTITTKLLHSLHHQMRKKFFFYHKKGIRKPIFYFKIKDPNTITIQGHRSLSGRGGDRSPSPVFSGSYPFNPQKRNLQK